MRQNTNLGSNLLLFLGGNRTRIWNTPKNRHLRSDSRRHLSRWVQLVVLKLLVWALLSGAHVNAAEPSAAPLGGVAADPAQAGEVNLIGSASDLAFDGQRAHIAKMRQQAMARHELMERACYQRFAVSDCLSDVRAKRRVETEALQRQEVEVGRREREQAAQVQRQSIAQHQQEQELQRRRGPLQPQVSTGEGAGSAAGSAAAADPAAGPNKRLAARPAAVLEPRKAGVPRTAAAQLSDEKVFDRKLREAQQHKADVLRKLAEKGVIAPKPLPAAP